MAKEQTFEHPPQGIFGLLCYDSVNDRWQVVHVDASGNLQVDVASIVAGQIQLYAWDGDSWEKVTIDAAGLLQVDVAAAAALDVQRHGYDGDSWQKAGLPLDFNAIVEEQISDTNLAAGTNTLDGAAVPAGEIWKLTWCSMVYVGTVPTRIYMLAKGLAVEQAIFWEESPTSARSYGGGVEIYLQEGDYIQGVVLGATLNDDVYFRYSGYKTKLSM